MSSTILFVSNGYDGYGMVYKIDKDKNEVIFPVGEHIGKLKNYLEFNGVSEKYYPKFVIPFKSVHSALVLSDIEMRIPLKIHAIKGKKFVLYKILDKIGNFFILEIAFCLPESIAHIYPDGNKIYFPFYSSDFQKKIYNKIFPLTKYNDTVFQIKKLNFENVKKNYNIIDKRCFKPIFWQFSFPVFVKKYNDNEINYQDLIKQIPYEIVNLNKPLYFFYKKAYNELYNKVGNYYVVKIKVMQ